MATEYSRASMAPVLIRPQIKRSIAAMDGFTRREIESEFSERRESSQYEEMSMTLATPKKRLRLSFFCDDAINYQGNETPRSSCSSAGRLSRFEEEIDADSSQQKLPVASKILEKGFYFHL